MKQAAEATDASWLPAAPSRRWRIVISLLVIGHLWAVVGRPIEFATQGPGGPSPAAVAFHAPVQGYSELAYLNHGYAFFAPDPGPSHLMRVEVAEAPDKEASMTYPDLTRQWPRLLYHRHFMLTEFLNNVYAPPIPDDLQQEVAEDDPWRAERKRYEAVRDSIRRHVQAARQLPALEAITIQRVEHRMPFVDEYLEERIRLNHPRLYRTLEDRLPPNEPNVGLPGLGGPPLRADTSSPDWGRPMVVPPGQIQPEAEEAP